MIAWVFFQSGSGGDGIANLLEHASNAVTIDGLLCWRIHRYVDNQVKFWAPNLQDPSIRNNNVNQLTENQLEIAKSKDKYLIITSHDISLKNTFNKQILPDEVHIKIYIKNNTNTISNGLIKNLIQFNANTINFNKCYADDNLLMDVIVDSTMLQSNWDYTKHLTSNIGLHLNKHDFDHYKKILSCQIIDTTPGIDFYKSYIDKNNNVNYIQINCR